MMINMLIVFLGLLQESTALTVELQQDGNPVLGSNGFQLSCIAKAEDDEFVERVTFLSRLGGTVFKSVILFLIKENVTFIINPDGSYLEGRITLMNLLSSENRTVVKYDILTCDDNTAYRCDVELESLYSEHSNVHSIEVKGTPNKPDTIPVRTPGFNICTGMNVNYSCSGMVGAPSGYFTWTKISNGSTTIYNETFNSDILRECYINRTSILSIEVQKEDNNAIFRCEVIHDLATSEMFQQTMPEMFVYGIVLDPVEYILTTKEPDKNYYDPTTPFIELTCFAQGCHFPSYAWYKDTDLNTTLGNDSLYRISDVEMENSGNYICIVETIINETVAKYSKTVTIDIRKDHSKEITVDKNFAETTADQREILMNNLRWLPDDLILNVKLLTSGIVTITVVSIVGVAIGSVVLFSTIKKVRHLRTLKTFLASVILPKWQLSFSPDTDAYYAGQDKDATDDHIYAGLQYKMSEQ